MKTIVNGQLIEYIDRGFGDTIVILHGWGSNMASFKELTDNLTEDYRVVRLDLPGFGKSPAPVKDWYVDDYAKIVSAFLDKIDVKRLDVIIGHSFGGRVVIKGVGKGYFKPSKVILIGSAGIRTKDDIKKHLYKFMAKTGKAVMKLPGLNKFDASVRKRFYDQIGNSDYLNSGKLKNTFLNTINEDLLPIVKKITMPTLLIWGEKDIDTPIEYAKQINAELENGELVIVPGAGHFVHVDKTKIVTEKIKEFLS